MYYYYPYYSSIPYAQTASSSGLFSKLFGGLNFSSILSGTQKTLNIVNQTIPIVKQASPMIKNAKSMFKIMNEFKKVDTPDVTTDRNGTNNNSYRSEQNNEQNLNSKVKEETNISSGPTFFL